MASADFYMISPKAIPADRSPNALHSDDFKRSSPAPLLANKFCNVYVSNMHVANPQFAPATDSESADVALRVSAALIRPNGPIPVVSAAAGMGKSAVLRSGVRHAARTAPFRVVSVSGRAVACSKHLDLIVATQLGDILPRASDVEVPAFEQALQRAADTTAVIVAIDDLDALLYKRPPLLVALGPLLRNPAISLACTIGADTSDRLVGARGALRAHVPRPLFMINLEPLSDAAAADLATRRNTLLTPCVTRAIVNASGGHPAAVAFLARFAMTCSASIGNHGELMHASEFAGAVYAGPWASLGPQQRAILLALADATDAQSAAQIAQRLALSASHVSAQLTRLRTEALVTQPIRGRFALPPLLGAWLTDGPSQKLSSSTATSTTHNNREP